MQNDALRSCYNTRRRDKISVRKMHTEANLLSLDQRREIQLLSLMYNHSTCNNVRKVVNCDVQREVLFILDTERYNTVKYKHSPFHKGAKLWDVLPVDTINSDTYISIKKQLYTVYVDL